MVVVKLFAPRPWESCDITDLGSSTIDPAEPEDNLRGEHKNCRMQDADRMTGQDDRLKGNSRDEVNGQSSCMGETSQPMDNSDAMLSETRVRAKSPSCSQ